MSRQSYAEIERERERMERKISSNAMAALNDMRKAGQLCDANICVEGGTFRVHRAIMSACSPYFRALFTNGMNESQQNDVTIPGINANMMSNIVDYAYTRDCDITEKNVQELLAAADQFNVTGLVSECAQYMMQYLAPENCIGIQTFARGYFCTELEKAASEYALRHFNEVSVKSEELLELALDDFAALVGSDDLNVRNEETVFDAILRWIDHDMTNRKPAIKVLLEKIRLGLLDTQFFVERVKVHPYIKENHECRPLVIETIRFLYDLSIDESKEVEISSPIARPRVPHEIMFVIGGWSGGSPTNFLETYDTRADRWIKVEEVDPAGPRAYHGCAALGNRIYMMGGFDGVDYFNSVRCFDPVTKFWREVAPMNSRRCYVGVAVCEGYIYAMGGFDGHVRLNTAERYEAKANQWSMIAPMNCQRSDASATTLDNKIYITGGFNGQECMSSCEMYDPDTKQWTLITSMRNRRSGVGCIAHRGCLYALGGFNGISRMCSGEKYDPILKNWLPIPDMYNPRSNFAIEVIDDMVFAIGGFNGVTTIFHVECYDDQTNEWYEATDMNVYRSALSACVIMGLPNRYDYIHKNRDKLMEEKKQRLAERKNERQS